MVVIRREIDINALLSFLAKRIVVFYYITWIPMNNEEQRNGTRKEEQKVVAPSTPVKTPAKDVPEVRKQDPKAK